jgi:putative ABC transport system permease protein
MFAIPPLYTDVSEHVAEYAILKAMGYENSYLLSVVFQEALILSVLGYIPGFFLSLGLYDLTRNATSPRIGMTAARAVLVLFLSCNYVYDFRRDRRSQGTRC